MKKELQNQIIIYESDNGDSHVEVRFEGETAWLTQAQLVELFQSSKANISEHIKNIYAEKELSPQATVRNFRTVQKEGVREVSRDIEHYNLVSAYFDLAEINALEQKPMKMVDYIYELDNILKSTGKKPSGERVPKHIFLKITIFLSDCSA